MYCVMCQLSSYRTHKQNIVGQDGFDTLDRKKDIEYN